MSDPQNNVLSRAFLKSIAMLVSILFLATACASPEREADAAEAPTLIRLSPVALPLYTPMMVMEDKPELFEELNVEFEITWFSNGVDSINSVLAKQSDAGISATLPLLTFLEKDADLILPFVFVNADNQRIIAKNSIKTGADLEGKRVAVPQNSSAQYALMRYLEKNGVDPDTVELVFSDPSELPTLLGRDAADAMVWVEPIASRAVELAGEENVHYLEDPRIGEVFRDIAPWQVGRHFYEKYGDEGMITLARAFDIANSWIVENPDEAAALAEKNLKLDPGMGKWLLEDSQAEWPVFWDDASLAAMTDVAQWALDEGLISEMPDWSEYVDTSWLQQVRPENVEFVKYDY